MVPTYYVPLEEFIYTPNGKIDRKKLPLPKNLSKMSNEEYIAPKNEIQKKLVKVFENVLNVKPIGINDNFFELGGDSLLAMKLSVELLKITNKISYSDIFKYSTVSEMEEKINLSNEKTVHNRIEEIPESTLKILKDTIQESEIKEYHPRNILLTGVTGYLGIHILEEFIKNESGKVYCIVRNEPGLSINTKITQKLEYYFNGKYKDLINKRIIPILGDICKENFGLSAEVLNNVTGDIDVVINSAANVAHYGKYDNFYNTNVNSVKYMLEFCEKYNKKFYHISTTGVSGKKLNSNYSTEKNKEFKENSLYIGQYLDNVYTYSKFEAETKIFEAISRNVDSYILRLGNLMPRISDGLFQENVYENAFVTKIATFMKLGIIPESLSKSDLEFTPVDVAAQAIYKIVTNTSKKNRVFHVYNNNFITLKDYIEDIKDFGYNLKIVTEDHFRKEILKILQDEKQKTILQNITSDLDNNYNLNYNQNEAFGYKKLEKGTQLYSNGLIKSLEELKKECTEWNNDAYNESSDGYSSDLNQKLRDYDENYFKENALIIVTYETANYLKTKLKHIIVDGSTLIVNIKQTTKIGNYSTEAYFWSMLIEIKKNDIINVDELKVNCSKR